MLKDLTQKRWDNKKLISITKKEEDDFKKSYSFYYDFPAELQVYDVKDAAHKDIFDRITQDIFNDTLAKW